MKKICISTETTVDIPVELQKQYDIKVIPFTVLLGDRVGIDGEITPTDIFEYVDDTGVLPKTSAVNEFQYDEFFTSLLEEYEEIVHISLSHNLSSAYQNALLAAEKFNGKVKVFDSLSLSTGIALQVIYASELRDEGKSSEEIISSLEKRRGHAQASFVLNTLSYLHKGGRCSAMSNIIGTLFRIKPQIIVTPEGKMVPGKKYMGRGTPVVRKYVEDTLEQFPNIDKKHVFLTHSHATEDMVNAAIEVLKEHGVENIHITLAQATISSHCGPKCLGVLYYNDKK